MRLTITQTSSGRWWIFIAVPLLLVLCGRSLSEQIGATTNEVVWPSWRKLLVSYDKNTGRITLVRLFVGGYMEDYARNEVAIKNLDVEIFLCERLECVTEKDEVKLILHNSFNVITRIYRGDEVTPVWIKEYEISLFDSDRITMNGKTMTAGNFAKLYPELPQ